MAQAIEEKVAIQDDLNNEQPGILKLTVFANGDRVKRGAILLLAGWAIAAVAVPIPIFHLIVVPIFLLGTPYFAYKRYKLVRSMEAVEGDCPRCQKSVRIKLETDDVLPKWTYCPACNGSVQLLPASQGTASAASI